MSLSDDKATAQPDTGFGGMCGQPPATRSVRLTSYSRPFPGLPGGREPGRTGWGTNRRPPNQTPRQQGLSEGSGRATTCVGSQRGRSGGCPSLRLTKPSQLTGLALGAALLGPQPRLWLAHLQGLPRHRACSPCGSWAPESERPVCVQSAYEHLCSTGGDRDASSRRPHQGPGMPKAGIGEAPPGQWEGRAASREALRVRRRDALSRRQLPAKALRQGYVCCLGSRGPECGRGWRSR